MRVHACRTALFVVAAAAACPSGDVPSDASVVDGTPSTFVYEIRLGAQSTQYEVRADDTVVAWQPPGEMTIITRTYPSYDDAKLAPPVRLETWLNGMRIDARGFNAGACDTLCNGSSCEFGPNLYRERADIMVTSEGALLDYIESMSCLFCEGDRPINICL